MNKKITLLSVGLVGAIALVGTSLAFVYQSTNASATGNLDKGLVVKWGEEGSYTLGDVDNLTYGVPVEQTLVLAAPTKSSGVTGTINLTFTLTDNSESPIIIVELSDEAWTSGTGSDVIHATPDATLFAGAVEDINAGSSLTQYTYEFDVASFSDAKTIYVRYSLQHSPVSQLDAGDGTISGTLNASVTYDEGIGA